MGTDVHMILEHTDWCGNIKAVPVPDKFTGRNYPFFALIGNVRNGYGFAGCETHAPIKPISDRRGFPQDMSKDGVEWSKGSESYLGWCGDHSFSYVTLEELKAQDLGKPTPCVGYVESSVYKAWKASGDTNPESWCGGVGGPNIVIIDEYDYQGEDNVYVYARWSRHLIDQKRYNQLIQWMECYIDEWTKKDVTPMVRLVFGFDS